MNTQSHAVLTYFLIRKGLDHRIEKVKHLNAILFSGALFPDLPLYVFFGWFTFVERTPQEVLWGEIYYRTGWQDVVSAFHSLPLWSLAAAVCLAGRRRGAALFCLAAFLAAAEDFFLHNEDAHAHFFPFSGYRFRSAISYWNPVHYGQYASLAEIALVLAVSTWTWRRIETQWGKGVLILAIGSLVLSDPFWVILFSLGG